MAAPNAPLDLSGHSFAELERFAAIDALPPVERWHPRACGHSGMRIARDGGWYHQGAAIRRPEMVRLFSRILRREPDGRYVLVTPAEMLDVDVEDLPFVAVELKSSGTERARNLGFRLGTGDFVVAGPDHPIRVAAGPDGPLPALHVRAALEARIARPVYYELAEHALEEGADPPGLWSGGRFFRLDAAE